MGIKDKTYSFNLKKDNIHKIEYFVDFICDQLLINETYSGNLLMVMTEFINLTNEVSINKKINISYSTDYKNIKITIKNIDNQIIKLFNSKIGLSDIEENSINKSLYLIRTLTDCVETNEVNELNLTFDISAVHDKVYFHRQNTLNAYFNQSRLTLIKSDDSI